MGHLAYPVLVIETMRAWNARRWWVAGVGAVATVLLIALGTAMIPNPVIVRSVPPTWWSWPALVVTGVLSGLLLATYVRQADVEDLDERSSEKKGYAGALFTWFAVGCPVCNKIALLLLGASGAMKWFAPVQPFLGLIGIVLLGVALVTRLRGEKACPTRPAAPMGGQGRLEFPSLVD